MAIVLALLGILIFYVILRKIEEKERKERDKK